MEGDFDSSMNAGGSDIFLNSHFNMPSSAASGGSSAMDDPLRAFSQSPQRESNTSDSSAKKPNEDIANYVDDDFSSFASPSPPVRRKEEEPSMYNDVDDGTFFQSNDRSNGPSVYDDLSGGIGKMSIDSNKETSLLTNGIEPSARNAYGSGNKSGGKIEEQQECAALKEWQKKHEADLKKIEEEERQEIENQREHARNQIAEFYERRKNRIAQNMKANHAKEEEKTKGSKGHNASARAQMNGVNVQGNGDDGDLRGEESWKKVVEIVDFSKNTHERDTSRFKEILLSLSSKSA